MKKFSFIIGFCTMLVFASLLVSCQKEQDATTEGTANTSTENSNVVGVAGNGPFAGSINTSYAAALAANYAKKYDDADQPQYVTFNAKDLVAFINNLQAKYKSDLIYVNFGVYGKGALPVNSKDYGRLTVFFTGNKIPAPSASRRTDGLLDDVLDEFLNHGQIYP